MKYLSCFSIGKNCVNYMKTILTVALLTLFTPNLGCFSNDTAKYLEDIESENIVVSNDAIYHLGKKKEKRALPKLTEVLKSSQPIETRLRAIQAVGEIGEGSSIDALVDILDEKDNEIRIAAIEAIGKIKTPKAVRPLINLLENQDLRLTVIWALGNIGDNSAVPAMTKLVGHHDKYVRYNATRALKQIGSGK